MLLLASSEGSTSLEGDIEQHAVNQHTGDSYSDGSDRARSNEITVGTLLQGTHLDAKQCQGDESAMIRNGVNMDKMRLEHELTNVNCSVVLLNLCREASG